MTTKIIIAFIFFLSLISCSSEQKNEIKIIQQLNYSKLKTKKIYFGHQSVGNNLIDGIKYHLQENPESNISISELIDTLNINSGLNHSNIGKNRDPISKINSFNKLIENDLNNQIEIAGFKFCYVDFNDETNIQEVFSNYREVMDNLSEKYPKINFIHFTVPLKTIENNPKNFIKKILGKDIGLKNNKARQEFNNLLVEHYDQNSIFDIAKIESTYPNGKRNFSLVNNEKIYSMVNEYSNDGGHLSDYGKKYIGGEFLMFLDNFIKDE